MNDLIKESVVLADKQHYYIPKLRSAPDFEPAAPRQQYSEQNVLDFESLRNKVMSRVFSIDKLVEKYRKVLNEQQVEAVEDALVELRKRVRKLKLASSIHDSLLKTANIVRGHSAIGISDALISIAAEPLAPATPLMPEEPTAPLKAPVEAPEAPVEVDEEEPAQKKDAPDNEVEEGEQDYTPRNSLTPKQREIVIGDIVDQLEGISTVIKSREIVRAIARVDILLNRLYMDTFFPELSDAQAKLIEAYSYASNKIEDILPKIKGGASDDHGYKLPELSDESKSLAKEVSDLSEQLVHTPAENIGPEVGGGEDKPGVAPKNNEVGNSHMLTPKKPSNPAPAEKELQVEEEEDASPLLHQIPALEK